MRLLFPNGEHAPVELTTGETSIGEAPDATVSVRDTGLSAYHAAVLSDAQRGVWLRVDARNAGAHVNARPVKEIAMLRVGDLVTLGSLQLAIGMPEGMNVVQELPPVQSPSSDPARRAAASRVVLRGVAGATHGCAFPLASDISIGSASDCAVRLDGAGVAEHHATLELREEGILLRSAGGQSRVNGVVVNDAVMHQGDQLAIGAHRFVLEAPGMAGRDLRGGGKRGATYTITAVNTPVPRSFQNSSQANAESAPTEASSEAKPSSGFNVLWLLFAAIVIAALMYGILSGRLLPTGS